MEQKTPQQLFEPSIHVDEKLRILEEKRKAHDKKLIDSLIYQLEEEEHNVVREKIILLLEELLDANDRLKIEQMLQSSDAYVRNSAIEITQNNLEEYEIIAQDFFYHHDKDIRKYALDIFGGFNTEYIKSMIVERLEDEDINVCITAIEKLGKLPIHAGSIEVIENKLLTEPNVLLQCTALKTLSYHKVSPQYKKILQRFATEMSLITLNSLTEYLTSVGDERAIDFILDHCAQGHYSDWMIAVHAVKKLIDTISSGKTGKMYYDKLKRFAKTFGEEAMEWYIHQIFADYDAEDFESYKEFLISEERQGNTEDIVQFIERIGETGDDNDIALLENLAEHAEMDSVLEAIGEAIVTIKERNGFPKH